ncbi:conserved hypothetical protein [Arthrobacter sp. 9AX]|uniref:hypothetical protein n=1 Tax=Arthrobacter sp. 9AX TaxID=2653131 RepID=UPI0012F3EBAB|nr:hypothetical protein [Arthrobacter sp. 9AX]VXB94346.1 conserved hypothetical protein [Arthrobacter sp. 9AX]
MTENRWPEDPAYTAPPASTGIPGERSATTFPPAATSPDREVPGSTSGTSRKEAAKEEAADVARTAADSAQNVAQTAKEEVANVASEAKHSAQDLLAQAKSGLSDQAGTQQQKAAEGIRNISSQLHSMASAPEQQGVASDLIRQAAQRSESVASWLENKQPGDLLGEVQRFARNRPGTFLLLAAGAGVLAGRLTRGLAAGTETSSTAGAGRAGTSGLSGQYSSPYGDQYAEGYAAAGGTVPPPPVQSPAPATAAGFDGGAPGTGYPSTTPYPSAASAPGPLGSPQLVEEEPWAGSRTAEDPLGDRSLADDPMAGDPLTRDRSRDGQSGGL